MIVSEQFEQWAAARNAAVGTEMFRLLFSMTAQPCRRSAWRHWRHQFCIDKMQIEEDMLIIAGDNLFTYRLQDAWQHFRQHGDDMVLASRLGAEEDLSCLLWLLLMMTALSLRWRRSRRIPNRRAVATYFYQAETLPLIGHYLQTSVSMHELSGLALQTKPLRCYL